MSKTRARYAAEFRRQMIELVRAGRSPEELSRAFEPSAQTIRNWLALADRDVRSLAKLNADYCAAVASGSGNG